MSEPELYSLDKLVVCGSEVAKEVRTAKYLHNFAQRLLEAHEGFLILKKNINVDM